MKVRATAMGFAGGGRRRVGDVFDVPEGAKATWFEPVPAAEIPVEVEPPAPKRRRGVVSLADAGRQVGADLGNADLA